MLLHRKMVDSDDLYGQMEVDDDLSTALGTETLADRDMVPPLASTTPRVPRQTTYLSPPRPTPRPALAEFAFPGSHT